MPSSKTRNKRKSNKKSNSKRYRPSKSLLLFLIIFAAIGTFLLYRSFASILNRDSNVIAEVYEEANPGVNKFETSAHLVGRLYTDGRLLCTINKPEKPDQLQRYKVVPIESSVKKNVVQQSRQKELQPSEQLEEDNFNKITVDTPRVEVYDDDEEVAVHPVDDQTKKSTRKTKAQNIESLIRNSCKGTGTEYIPTEVTASAKLLRQVPTNAVAWPQGLIPIPSKESVLASNTARIKEIHQSESIPDAEFRKKIIAMGLYEQSDFEAYSTKVTDPSSSKRLYMLAKQQNSTVFNIVANGDAYEVSLGFELPPTVGEAEGADGGSENSSADTSLANGVKNQIVPKANAATPPPPPVRDFRIKVLITDENRAVRPSLHKYAQVAQQIQLWMPGQSSGKMPEVAEISYHETSKGVRAERFCGPAGYANCDTELAVARARVEGGVNVANKYTYLVIVAFDSEDACGRAYMPGSVGIVMDTRGGTCWGESPGHVAATTNHEFFHSLGFNHNTVRGSLMDGNGACGGRELNRGCFLSADTSRHINGNPTYNSALRKKAIPGFNCPSVFGVAYPDVRRGSRGDCVKMLQWRLNNFNNGTRANLAEDGVFGTATENSVRFIQSLHRYPVTGVVDSNTWQLINALST